MDADFKFYCEGVFANNDTMADDGTGRLLEGGDYPPEFTPELCDIVANHSGYEYGDVTLQSCLDEGLVPVRSLSLIHI